MSIFKEFVVPTIVLSGICLVVSGALAATYGVTAPIIEANGQALADATRVQVLEDGDEFVKIESDTLPEGIVDAYQAQNGAGYVITTEAKGYSSDGPIRIMVGITSEGKIDKVKVLNISETQGLGSRVAEEDYLGTFEGMGSTLDGLSAISGATVSSGAMKSAVTKAFQAYGDLAGIKLELGIPEEQTVEEYLDELLGGGYEPVEAPGVEAAYRVGDRYGFITHGTGFNSATPMRVLTLVGADGKIEFVRLMSSEETEGIGTKVAEPEYTDKYTGQTSGDAVEAVAGATLSSNGMKEAVGLAMEAYHAVKGA